MNSPKARKKKDILRSYFSQISQTENMEGGRNTELWLIDKNSKAHWIARI